MLVDALILFKVFRKFILKIISQWLSYLTKMFQLQNLYEGVSKSFRTGSLERELQIVQFSATKCTCIAILWVSLVSFAALTLCAVPHRVFIVVVYFVIDSVRKLLDTPSYGLKWVWNKIRNGGNVKICKEEFVDYFSALVSPLSGET